MERLILLARHGTHGEVGRVLSGRSEIPLDTRGRGEAAALARGLAGAGLRSIWTSPRARTVETAAAVAAASGLGVAETAALDEVDFGAFAGRRFAELDGDPDWQRWNAERAAVRCPGGETMGEAVARARLFLRALPAAACPALCVTHCDIIRGVVADLLGLELGSLLRLGCDPGSVTRIDADGGLLLSLNERVG